MASTTVKDKDARREMYAGAAALAEAVSVTMGPRGKLVVIDDQKGVPHLTKDGVTVANAIEHPDPLKNAGLKIVREASKKTAELAGDGTTTTCILAYYLLKHHLDRPVSKVPNLDREWFEGLDFAYELANDYLDNSKVDLTTADQIKSIATISANSDTEMGELISQAIEKLGPQATIMVEESRTYKSSLDFVDGTEIDRGFISPHFSNSELSAKCKFDKPSILIAPKKLESFKEVIPALENVSQNNRPLLIFAEDYAPEVIKSLLVNKERAGLRVCACKLPEFGQGLYESAQDLAALFNCETFLTEKFDHNKHLGYAEFVEVSKNKTLVKQPEINDEALKLRIQGIKEDLEDCVDEDHSNQLRRRLQRISNGIAILRIGAATEIELKEKLDRVDDAVSATRVAVEHGILPGAGVALLNAAFYINTMAEQCELPSSSIKAMDLFLAALFGPFSVILTNSGYNDNTVDKIHTEIIENKNSNFGYDSLKGEFCDLVENGIIDPYFVTKQSLANAYSVAKKILEVGYMISTNYDSFEGENI